MNNSNPTARRHNLVIQELPGEVLVYDLDTHKAHCLNESAALVWRSCDGDRSVTDIVAEFESSGLGKVSEDFVWLALDQLNESSLLDSDIPAAPSKRSRREIVRSIGLASFAAGPITSSIVAPPNALANTNCGSTSPVDCNVSPSCPSTVNCNANGICAP